MALANLSKYSLLLGFLGLISQAPRAWGEDEEKTEEKSSDVGGASDTNAADTEKGSSGRLIHHSGESASKNGASIQLEFKMQNHPGFTDYRNLARNAPNQIFIPEAPQTPARLHLLESEFDFRVAAYGYAQRGAFLNLVGGLPFRYLSSSDKNAAQGTEFGGYEVGFEGSPVRGLVLRTTIADRRSSKFELIDKHYEWKTSLRYQAYESVGANLSLGTKVGPQYTKSFGQGTDAYVHYGNIAGAGADALADIRVSGYIITRIGVGADFERVLDYQTAGVDQGGAGVMTVSPYIEVPVMDVLWVGVRFDLPAFRPVGHELAFGNLAQPGLFGKSVNFTLEAMNF